MDSKSIPTEWVDCLIKKNEIFDMCTEFCEAMTNE